MGGGGVDAAAGAGEEGAVAVGAVVGAFVVVGRLGGDGASADHHGRRRNRRSRAPGRLLHGGQFHRAAAPPVGGAAPSGVGAGGGEAAPFAVEGSLRRDAADDGARSRVAGLVLEEFPAASLEDVADDVPAHRLVDALGLRGEVDEDELQVVLGQRDRVDVRQRDGHDGLDQPRRLRVRDDEVRAPDAPLPEDPPPPGGDALPKDEERRRANVDELGRREGVGAEDDGNFRDEGVGRVPEVPDLLEPLAVRRGGDLRPEARGH
mmetsp:Transcript_37629/g.120677  ORF Transcript_37629/g.120677 Transcript_37629/m.120677 type:complete len:263 (+) Transcript_37629:294-1082(+)